MMMQYEEKKMDIGDITKKLTRIIGLNHDKIYCIQQMGCFNDSSGNELAKKVLEVAQEEKPREIMLLRNNRSKNYQILVLPDDPVPPFYEEPSAIGTLNLGEEVKHLTECRNPPQIIRFPRCKAGAYLYSHTWLSYSKTKKDKQPAVRIYKLDNMRLPDLFEILANTRKHNKDCNFILNDGGGITLEGRIKTKKKSSMHDLGCIISVPKDDKNELYLQINNPEKLEPNRSITHISPDYIKLLRDYIRG